MSASDGSCDKLDRLPLPLQLEEIHVLSDLIPLHFETSPFFLLVVYQPMFHRQLETVNGNESLRAKWKHLSWESSCKESAGGPPWSHICPLCGCWKRNWAVLRAQFSRAPPLRGRGWRWVVAMRSRKAPKTEIVGKGGTKGGGRGEGVQERRKRQARRENTGVVYRKGGACQVRMRRRRGAGSLSRRELGPALRRSDETKPPRMLANNDLDRVIRPSLEMESLLMAAPVQRTKILLSFYCHQFVVSLTLRGEKYI